MKQHAYECLGACLQCEGSGRVVVAATPSKKQRKGRRKKRRRGKKVACPECLGSGACGAQWRQDPNPPPGVPCRLPACCLCRPCGQRDPTKCQVCGPPPQGRQRCAGGGCPQCAHKYIEWLSYDTGPRDVHLVHERLAPSNVTIRRNGAVVFEGQVDHNEGSNL